MRGGPDLEPKAHVDGMGGTDLADQFLGHGLDIADAQIAVDLFERRLVGERLVDQYRALHDLLPSPEARGEAALVACILGETQALFLAVGDMAEAVDGDV